MSRHKNNNAAYIAQQRQQQANRQQPAITKQKPRFTLTTAPSSAVKPIAPNTLPVATHDFLVPQIIQTYYGYIPRIELPKNKFLCILFILLMLANKAFAQQCDDKLRNDILSDDQLKTIKRQLNEVVSIPPETPAASQKEMKEACRSVKQEIIQTLIDLPHSIKLISQVIHMGGFGIRCQPDSFMKKTNAEAVFSPLDKLVHFNAEKIHRDGIRKSIIAHELTHAYDFFLHQTKQCKEQKLPSKLPLSRSDLLNSAEYRATTPIYPITRERIKEYNDALDKGDKRIAEFNNLIKKAIQLSILSFNDKSMLVKNKPLSNLWNTRENRLLNDYLAATSHLTIEKPVWSITSKGFYMKLIANGWKDNEKNYLETSDQYGIAIEITKIRAIKEGSQTIYQLYERIHDEVKLVLSTPYKVKTLLASEIYQGFTEELLTAERNALTSENMSEKAWQTFYKEANAMRQEYIKQCSDPAWEEFYTPPSCSR